MRPLVLGLLLLAPTAAAQEIHLTGPLRGSGGLERMHARDTAVPVEKWSIGLFDPLRIPVGDDVELATHPLLFLALAPNAEIKVRHSAHRPRERHGEFWSIASTWGLSVPTVPMRLTQGALFPKWEEGGGRVGWFVVPSVGLLATHGDERSWTLALDTAIGISLGPNDARPLDGYAPLEVLFGPALNGTRVHGRVTYDVGFGKHLRARVGLDGWFLGRGTPEPEKSPWILGAHGGFDFHLTWHTRLALGVRAYDYDDHRQEVRKDEAGKWHRVAVRSVDVYPTLDFIYEPSRY